MRIKLHKDITEEELIELVLNDFRKVKARKLRDAEIMSKKNFNFGDIVIKNKSKGLDGTFGINKDDIGVIVGAYELEGKKDEQVLGYSNNPDRNAKSMYGVYYSDLNSYIGEWERDIEIYKGEIPEHLRNVTWNDIYYEGF